MESNPAFRRTDTATIEQRVHVGIRAHDVGEPQTRATRFVYSGQRINNSRTTENPDPTVAGGMPPKRRVKGHITRQHLTWERTNEPSNVGSDGKNAKAPGSANDLPPRRSYRSSPSSANR
mgnify:FL=1